MRCVRNSAASDAPIPMADATRATLTVRRLTGSYSAGVRISSVVTTPGKESLEMSQYIGTYTIVVAAAEFLSKRPRDLESKHIGAMVMTGDIERHPLLAD